MALAPETNLGGRRRRGGGRWRGRGGRARGRGSYRGKNRRTHSSGQEFELASSSDEDESCYGGDDPSLSSGGYDCDFVKDVPASLQCLICTLPAREPQQVSCCGKIFCLSCLDILKKSKNKSCPNCRNQSWTSFFDKKSELYGLLLGH